MNLLNVKDLFTYLNCPNVSYQFLTKDWFMEIEIQFKNFSLKFYVKQKVGVSSPAYSLFTEEHFNFGAVAGVKLIAPDVSLDVYEDNSLIYWIAEYIQKITYLMGKAGTKVVVKETLVHVNPHVETYYNNFLGHLHAAGFIDTYWQQHVEMAYTNVVVYVVEKELKRQ